MVNWIIRSKNKIERLWSCGYILLGKLWMSRTRCVSFKLDWATMYWIIEVYWVKTLHGRFLKWL